MVTHDHTRGGPICTQQAFLSNIERIKVGKICAQEFVSPAHSNLTFHRPNQLSDLHLGWQELSIAKPRIQVRQLNGRRNTPYPINPDQLASCESPQIKFLSETTEPLLPKMQLIPILEKALVMITIQQHGELGPLQTVKYSDCTQKGDTQAIPSHLQL